MNSTLLKLALRNLWRHRRRHVISITMIGISLAGLVLVAAHRYRHDRLFATNGTFQARRGHLIISKPDGLDLYASSPAKYGLLDSDLKAIEAAASDDPDVDFTGAYREEMGLLSNGCDSVPVIVNGIDMAVEDRILSHPDVRAWLPDLYERSQNRRISMFSNLGAPIAVTPWILSAMQKPLYTEGAPLDVPVTVDCSKAEAFSDSFVQMILKDEYGDLYPVDGYLTNIEEASNNFLSELAIETPVSALTNRRGSYSYVALYLKDQSRAQEVLQRWRQNQTLAAYEIQLSNGPAVNPVYTSLLGWLWSVEYFVYTLMSFILILTVANFLVMSIHERRAEIATYLALGFKKSFMIRLFGAETLFLTVGSIIFGSLTALGAITIINSLDLPYLPPGASIDVSFKLAASPAIYVTRSVAVLVLAMLTALVVTNIHCRYDRMVSGLLSRL